MTNALIDAVARQSKAFLQIRAHSTGILWNGDNFLGGVLPEPSRRAGFFIDWVNLTAGRWQLQEQDHHQHSQAGLLQSHLWSFRGTLTIAQDYFVFPRYHSHLPPAVNYGGAGRLIADEVLRGLFHEALLAALSAYRLAVVQDLSSAYARLSSLAQDTLFFVASCYALCSSGRYVDPLYGDARRRCNEPVKELPEFAAAFRCNLPYTQS
ncbi:hypothetical protein MRX96_038917 [Rhipicephalus microplus]